MWDIADGPRALQPKQDTKPTRTTGLCDAFGVEDLNKSIPERFEVREIPIHILECLLESGRGETDTTTAVKPARYADRHDGTMAPP